MSYEFILSFRNKKDALSFFFDNGDLFERLNVRMKFNDDAKRLIDDNTECLDGVDMSESLDF